jgi:pimeloyl-ACP methyl ester carboxylesterase
MLSGRTSATVLGQPAAFLEGGEIEAAGHYPQLEQPAAVNLALRRFLAALP